MEIDQLTIGQAKALAAMFGAQPTVGLNGMLGQKVIVRTYSAGVWFGTLSEKSGDEVVLTKARRMWLWKAKEGISLSACALYGVDTDNSKIVEAVSSVWLQAIEIIPCSQTAIASLERAKSVQAQ